jgi:predicted short-subunit dehydrogenase-like oxidoreductase (DUF2520 family)
MALHNIRRIVIIGAGKLATNFALTLKKKGFTILQVYNRSKIPGAELAAKVSSSFIDDLNHLSEEGDLYALAVSDTALRKIADRIRLSNQLIIHFSGTVEMDVLSNSSKNFGVLYPPQTFTMRHTTGFVNIPLCIEAGNSESEKKLEAFASDLSDKIFKISSSQRKFIHLSAIFAGNFTNFMYSIAEEILASNNLPMSLMEPIITKTKSNVKQKNIFRLQTGPAIREDMEMIRAHLALLSDTPEFSEIYRLLSESIIKYKHKVPNDKL